MDEIKNHEWFNKFHWKNLKNREMKAPFIPKVTYIIYIIKSILIYN